MAKTGAQTYNIQEPLCLGCSVTYGICCANISFQLVVRTIKLTSATASANHPAYSLLLRQNAYILGRKTHCAGSWIQLKNNQTDAHKGDIILTGKKRGIPLSFKVSLMSSHRAPASQIKSESASMKERQQGEIPGYWNNLTINLNDLIHARHVDTDAARGILTRISQSSRNRKETHSRKVALEASSTRVGRDWNSVITCNVHDLHDVFSTFRPNLSAIREGAPCHSF